MPAKKNKTKKVARQSPRSSVGSTRTPCTCQYNHRISKAFDESFDKLIGVEGLEEYHTALVHSDKFDDIMEALGEDDNDPYLVIADAVRIGFDAGKRMNECDKLEAMVGYK
jgi:hypothetical protein